ncbi:MAG: hypothetical protein IT537_09250 [Hyphomicrobiales bacterium]|nr:hypothetical protein [Hyphomicrobiales bacterium]
MRALRAAAALLLLALGACDLDSGTGYVEIKAVPASATLPLYFDSVKLEPMRNGSALLRQRVGTAKLQTDTDGHMSLLCQVEVKKNRITSVTVSVVTRQVRCQCGRTESASARTCIG